MFSSLITLRPERGGWGKRKLTRFSCSLGSSTAPAPEPERCPYHDHDQCPEGQAVKSSGEWQYYQAVPGEERARCPICVELDQAER